jgi:glutathione S-transferase
MKLYGHPFSTCTRKVLITLAEKGLKADFVHVELAKGEQKNPNYLAKHPFGVVPFFEDGDFSMYESRAICRYLDAKYSNPKLTPTDFPSLGKMEQWISVEQSYVASASGRLFVQKFLIPMGGGQSDLSIVEQARKDAHHAFNVINNHLRTQPYFAGEQFTLADIFMMPYHAHLEVSKELEILESYPHVMAWWNRVSQRPSWKQFSK